MKTKIILTCAFLLLNAGVILSQNLANTIWLGTNPPSPNMFFQFGNDTISYSTGSSYNPLSLYTASNGLFNVYDLPGTMCTDTGHYTYAISNNHLVFTEINDVCVSRRNTLVNYNWNLFSSNIASPLDNIISIYPNPNHGGQMHYLLGKYSGTNVTLEIIDTNGKIIYSIKLTEESGEINLREFNEGIYIGRLHSVSGEYTFKILR